MQFARSGMLHIAQNDIGGFPPPRLHDGQRIKTGHHHVLGGADAHGVAGKCAKDGRIEASPAGGPLDDPPDGRGRQRPLVRPVEVKRPEQRTRLQLSGLEPAGGASSSELRRACLRFPPPWPISKSPAGGVSPSGFKRLFSIRADSKSAVSPSSPPAPRPGSPAWHVSRSRDPGAQLPLLAATEGECGDRS